MNKCGESKSIRSTRTIISLLLVCVITLKFTSYVNAACYVPTTDPLEEPTTMRLTYYTADEGAITSTGCHPFEGSCAGAKKYEGMVAMIWAINDPSKDTGESGNWTFLGYWNIRDYGKGLSTGNGQYSIPAGYSLDLYFNTDHAGEEFMERYGNNDCLFKVLIVPGEG